METILAIALIGGLSLILLLIRYLVNVAANKTEDAIRNHCVRRKAETEPPREQALADRLPTPVRTQGRF